MTNRIQISALLGAALAGAMALAVAGCGGTTGTALGLNTNPRIRTVDMISSPATSTILIDNQTISANAAFGYASTYNIFPNGNHTVQFLAQTTNATLVNISPLFTLNEYATVIAYNAGASTYGSMVVSDVPTTIDQNVRIKVVNAAAATGPVDVYVTLTGQSITGQPATASDVQVGDTSQPYVIQTAGPGSYQVTVTTPAVGGVQGKVLATSSSTALASGQSDTFVVADNSAGTATVTALPAYSY